jgi:hypothetical protein
VWVAPGHEKAVAGWLPLPAGARIIAMMGHYHARGSAYKAGFLVQGGPTNVVYTAESEGSFEFERWDVGLAVPDGAGLFWQCDFRNDLTVPLTWGADVTRQEHCNVAAYYLAEEPGAQVVVTGELSAVALRGDTGSVVLDAPAGPLGVEVNLATDDSALLMPATVYVLPWQRTQSFAVQGARATRVRATTGAAVVTTDYDPG